MSRIVAFPARRSTAPTTLAEGAMEVQVAARDLRDRALACLSPAAQRSGSFDVLAALRDVEDGLHAAERAARRLAGLAEAEPACPDGLWAAGHGRAA